MNNEITEKSKDNLETSNQVLETADLKLERSLYPNQDSKANQNHIKEEDMQSNKYIKLNDIPREEVTIMENNESQMPNNPRNPEEDYIIGMDIKQKCTNIFFNYAKYSLELKEFFVSNQAIITLLKKINIYSKIQKSELDLILNKVSTNSCQKLTIVEFMNFLILLTKKLYPNDYCEDQISTLIFVIKQYFEPLSNYIENKQFNPNIVEHVAPQNNVFHQKIIETAFKTIENNVILIIRDILPGVKTIYQSYFYYECHKVKNKDKLFFGSLNNLIEFCRDYELSPYLFGINQLVTYWNYIINLKTEDITNNKEYEYLIDPKKELGDLMTLSKFCAFILHLGVLYYNKNKSLDIKSIPISNSGK